MEIDYFDYIESLSDGKLTQEYLKKILYYDPETGLFNRLIKITNAAKLGPTGYIDKSTGYWRISILGKEYYGHILAWFYMTGEWIAEIDHKNTIKSDNKWENLREATHSQNLMNRPTQSNNTSGYKGINWSKEKNKWRARIKVNNKEKFIGYFMCLGKAFQARKEAEHKYFGEFVHNAS